MTQIENANEKEKVIINLKGTGIPLCNSLSKFFTVVSYISAGLFVIGMFSLLIQLASGDYFDAEDWIVLIVDVGVLFSSATSIALLRCLKMVATESLYRIKLMEKEVEFVEE